ncbi:MAG: hypothetical protein GY909_13385 [Oligoflexia bacterium]|nr:hypothetical protein [Oligoflexia bacterium]
MPDNFLSVSSSSTDVNFFSYYTTSIVALVGYYTGPWVIFPFVFFTLFYTLQFSKRESAIDLINVVFLLLGTLFTCYFFWPSALGEGITYFIKEYFNAYTALFLGVSFIICFFAGSLRGTFKDVAVNFFSFLGMIPGKILYGLSFLKPSYLVNSYKKSKSIFQKITLLKLPKALKGNDQTGSERGYQRSLPNNMDTRREANKEKSTFSSLKDKFKRGGDKAKNSEKEAASSQNEVQYTPVIAEENFSSIEEESYEERDVSEVFEPAKSVHEASKLSDSDAAAAQARRVAEIKTRGMQRTATNDKEYYQIVTSLGQSRGENKNVHPDDKYFEDIIQRIEDKLSEFKIDAQVINILKGPVVDTFELDLGMGVKVSKVTNAEKDLSMALLGAPIRIVYPMVGRATVGIEVPRNPREIIYLDEVLNTNEFQSSNKKLPIAMGKDAFGDTFVVDLASMPHMLVAGATGAGKSVFINSLLVSLLVKKSPSQMKLILIDPKQLELALYAKLPHLVMPVITDAKTASISLLWACQEMERRYSILKEFGVRNIEGFNEKLKRATPEMLAAIHQHYENETEDHYELPYLVVIVDEFADLILTKAGKEIENNICRLAAKARAAGIHLVIATQRPSVDVITGLIKSNFPTRVSFRVTSSQDSRTILNSIGAEKLLGKGDMLYRHGTSNLRVHSSYVDENEIEVLTDKLTDMPQDFHEGAMNFLENGGEEEKDPYAFGSHIPSSDDSNGSTDDLYSEAVKTVVKHRTASASMLQRRLRIGYNRAANLIEEMEANGVVGPAEGSKRRKVLIEGE